MARTTKYAVGDRVIVNGYPGAVIALTDYGMVEARLERGSVCVDPEDELTIRHCDTLDAD